jgi:hypothetical protein
VTVLGFALRQRMHRLIANYDPNEENAAEREDKAAERTYLPEAFDELQATRVRELYHNHTGSPVIATARKPWEDENTPASNPWAKEPASRSSEPLIVTWWVAPLMFLEGGSIAIQLSATEQVTVAVPENAKPGDVLDLQAPPPSVTPFQVRLMAIRVHPDEMRLE